MEREDPSHEVRQRQGLHPVGQGIGHGPAMDEEAFHRGTLIDTALFTAWDVARIGWQTKTYRFVQI